MDKKELQELLELFSVLDDVKPAIKAAIKSIQAYGPEIKEFLNGIQLGIVDMRINAIRKYEAEGFTREEAIFMTMDEWFAYRRSLNKKSK